MPQADRHKDQPIPFRAPEDIRAWLAAESERRDISRSALINEALAEKRDREQS